MLALVVVIHLGTCAHPGGNLVEAIGRYFERSERAGTDLARREHRTDPAHGTPVRQGAQRVHHLFLGCAYPVRDDAKRLRHQREVALEIVEEGELERLHRTNLNTENTESTEKSSKNVEAHF